MCAHPSFLRSVFAACFSLCISTFSTLAQEAVELRFITFPQVQEPLEIELLIAKDKTVKLEIASNEASEPIRVPRLNSLIFGKSALDAEGKPTFNILGKGNMAAGKKQTVLILRRDKNGFEGGFEVRSVSNDPDRFGGGKLLMLNATSMPIAGLAGHQNKFALKPGQHTIIKPQREEDGRRAYVEFYYYVKDENGKLKPIPFFNSFWPVQDHFRGFVFFYQDPLQNNNVTFHSYRDFLLDEE